MIGTKLTTMLSKEEYNRYIRQIVLSEIGIKGQEKLKNAKVLVIGVGGLGSPVLFYLSAAGIGTIGIVDYDVVEESNLQRQILFSIDDIGKLKTESAKIKLSKQNPNVNYITHFLRLNKANALDVIKDYDIIVEGSDNFPTKYLVNDACVILNKPFVLGAVLKFEGQMGVFNYPPLTGPTYRCAFPEPPDPLEAPSCAEVGIIGVIPGLIGTLQANEVIKILTNIGIVLSGKLLLFDGLKMEFNIVDIKRNEEISKIAELRDYYEYCSFDYPELKRISSAELMQKILNNENIQLVDVREPEEYKLFHPQCVNIPLSEITTKYNMIAPDKEVIVYCQFGIKSQSVIRYLEKKHGFTNLYHLENGLEEYFILYEKERVGSSK